MSWNRNLLLGLSQNEYLSAKWLGGIQGAIDKISGQSVNVVSRQNSPLINLKIFSNYPIFGAGYQNATNIYVNLRNSLGTVDSQTSTTTYHLAAIGIAGIVFSIVVLIGILHLKNLTLLPAFCYWFYFFADQCRTIQWITYLLHSIVLLGQAIRYPYDVSK